MSKAFAFLALLSLSAFAETVSLPQWNTPVSDVLERGLSKERLYSEMNRDLIKVGSSICSNRALIWNYDFRREYGIQSAKMFLFYTKKKGHVSSKTWWYHVTPIINEGGELWTMDAGFPGFIDSPLTVQDWLEKFVGSSRCLEFGAREADLVQRLYSEQVFPEMTPYGQYDCYYTFAPEAYWTPASVADGYLQREGYVRSQFRSDELLNACIEASTTTLGRVFGGGKDKCKEYLGLQ